MLTAILILAISPIDYPLCTEIWQELQLGVESNLLTEREAKVIFKNCLKYTSNGHETRETRQALQES